MKRNFIFVIMLLIILVCSTAFAEFDDFSLVVTPDSDNNNIKLEWDLTSDETSKYTFKVYQQKENSNEFQTISTTNFEKAQSSKVKVLNVYPPVSEKVTFTYKDGKEEVLPKSAALKVWMEGGSMTTSSGSVETFDNYGRNPKTNEQIINVDLVDIDKFNEDPSIIWNYDVCMFGTWDYNGRKDLNEQSKTEVEKYIQKGKGVLCGHDTINVEQPQFWSLKDYFKIKEYTSFKYSGDIKIAKKGLLTNFPWEIGNIGEELKVPTTHNKQAAYGDIWMRFNGREDDADNFYLTSYQNTAMIQTGHSDCESTEDERKVLANTLFYLNQLTNATMVVDNSGQDLANPEKVTNISNSVVENTKKANITFDIPKDYGTGYTYYVEATDENGNVLKSNKKETVITTGVKGYNYIIDNNPTTEAGYDINLNTNTIENIDIDWSKETYLHIRSIDGGKNYSDTVHYKIEYKNIIKDNTANKDNTQNNNSNIKNDTTTTQKELPKAGKNMAIYGIILLIILLLIAGIAKYFKYRDIK